MATSQLFFFPFNCLDGNGRPHSEGREKRKQAGDATGIILLWQNTQYKQPEFQSCSAPSEEIKPCGYKVS